MARGGSVLPYIVRKDHAIPHDARKRWNSLHRGGLSLVSTRSGRWSAVNSRVRFTHLQGGG